MRRFCLAAALLALAALQGCAGSPLERQALATLISQHLVVSLPESCPAPDQLELELPPSPTGSLASVLRGSLDASQLSHKISQAVSRSLQGPGRLASQAFAYSLRSSGIFAAVLVGDEAGASQAKIDLRITRWGLAYDADNQRYRPVLDLEASLSVPVAGVVWRATRDVTDLSPGMQSGDFRLDPMILVENPEALNQALDRVAKDLCAQMVADLSKKVRAS
jgi:hypothetical protein